jgi:hypothetical protein
MNARAIVAKVDIAKLVLRKITGSLSKKVAWQTAKFVHSPKESADL